MKKLTLKLDESSLEVCSLVMIVWKEFLARDQTNSIELGVCTHLWIRIEKKRLITQEEYSIKLLEYEARSLLNAVQYFWAYDKVEPLTQSILSTISGFLAKKLA